MKSRSDRGPRPFKQVKGAVCPVTGYSCAYAYKHGCRCVACVDAHRIRCYRTKDRASRGIKVTLKVKCNFPDHRPYTGYQYGCRCKRCKAGNAETMKKYRDRRRMPKCAEQTTNPTG